jgi:hypothetical protein
MSCNYYYVIIMKFLSIKPIFVSISKMVEIFCSDADLTMPQCGVKSTRLL